MKRIIIVIGILMIGLSSCKKKRFCVDARIEAGKQHEIVEQRAQMVINNPTQENIMSYNKAVFYDSVLVDKMNTLCSKCKTCQQ